MINISTALLEAVRTIATLAHASPRLEAEVLLCHVLERPRSYLAAWPERYLTSNQKTAFALLVQRRLAGEPIAYILGQREFWNITLNVNPAVLIPRPETELLVELALCMGTKLQQTLFNRSLIVVDMGTGSGAIAAALARERPTWKVYATDISAEALKVALTNFQKIGVTVDTHYGSWYEALPVDLFLDVIVSNPPYIPEADYHLKQGDLIREPLWALTPGHDGLAALYHISFGAKKRLYPGGFLLLEHGYDQGQSVRDMLKQAGFTEISTYCDLAGHERATLAR